MALSAIFRFENLDSTSDLNSLYDGLFKKGVYEGGSIIQSTSTSIAISEFKAISYDGMHIINDATINLSIPSTGIKYYIVCKAKYVYDDSPIITMSLKTESALSADAEEDYYIKLGSVTLNGISASINLNDDRDELSVLGRNSYKGIFDDAETLESETSGKCQEGDWAVVNADSSGESIQIYIYSSGVWGGTGNAKILSTSYSQHVQNAGSENVGVAHNVPTESEMEGNEDKGAFHISYNQLKAIPDGINVTNKLIAEDNSRLLTSDQSNALKGNVSGGTPNENNRFVTSNTPIATFVNVSATMRADSAYIQISLPSSVPGYFVGKGVKGTAQYYFEIRNSDNTDVLLANGKPVVACGVYVGDNNWNITSEISPSDYGSNNYYWYESSSENKYLYLKTGDINGSATQSDITAGTCSVNLYCGTTLGSIDGNATSQRIYKQGLRQFSVITFDEAISKNLKIQDDTITINPSSTISLSLGIDGLVCGTNQASYSITPRIIESYYESGQYNYSKFLYDNGKLSIESQSSTNRDAKILIDTTYSSDHILEYSNNYDGTNSHATLDRDGTIKVYNPSSDNYYAALSYNAILIVSSSQVNQISADNGIVLQSMSSSANAKLTYNDFKISGSSGATNELTSSTITLTNSTVINTITNSGITLTSPETTLRTYKSEFTSSYLMMSRNPTSSGTFTKIGLKDIYINESTESAGYQIHLGYGYSPTITTVLGSIRICGIDTNGVASTNSGIAHLYTVISSNENENSGDSLSGNLLLQNAKNNWADTVSLSAKWVGESSTSTIMAINTHYSSSLTNSFTISATHDTAFTHGIVYQVYSNGYLNVHSDYQLGIWSQNGDILLGTNGTGNVIIGNNTEVRLNGNIYLQGDTTETNNLTIGGETKCLGGMTIAGNINPGSTGSATLTYRTSDPVSTGSSDPLFSSRGIAAFGYGQPVSLTSYTGFSLNPYDYIKDASDTFYPFSKNGSINSGKYVWIFNTPVLGAQDSTYQYVFKPLFAVSRRDKNSTGEFTLIE